MTPRPLGLKLGSDALAHGALQLDKYLIDDAPAVPATVTQPDPGYVWGMLANDSYGDCVAAALLHADESLYLKRGKQPTPYSASQALALYFNINGVPPGPAGSSSDQGTDPSVAMQYWTAKGFPGHKLAGFGQLPATSPNIRRAIWEFGTVIYAVALPTGAQSQGVNWRGNNLGAAGSWGGHGIAGNSFTSDLLGFVSWGEEGDMDNPFATAYLEQVFVPLSTDALSSAEVGPGGFKFAQMKADLPDPWNRS